MARAISVKPEFFRSERLVECSIEARLFYLCLNCHADRRDIVNFQAAQYSQIFPVDDCSIFEGLIGELHAAELIETCEQGLRLLHVDESVSVKRPDSRETFYAANRRAAKRQAMPAWADKEAIAAIYEAAKGQSLHVDHEIPLQHNLVCGLHVPANLRPISAFENLSKSNRFEVA